MTVRSIGLLCCAGLAIATVHGPQPATPASELPRFRVGVDVVRIDAVVTNRKGEIVTDVRPDEFEIYQDGKLQPVLVADFISTAAVSPTPQPPPDQERAQSRPARSTTSKPGRIIALVVDDLGLSWESLLPTRRALETFVDQQMQPDDRVGVLRTSTFSGTLQQFTSDRPRLKSAIQHLSFRAESRRSVEPFALIGNCQSDEMTTLQSGDVGHGSIDRLKEVHSALTTIGTLSLIIRGARELPGRKVVGLFSEGFSLRTEGGFPDQRILRRLDELYDQAARAGVVIYTIDVRGLQSGRGVAADGCDPGGDRERFLLDTQDSLFVIAQQTGGVAMENSNDLSKMVQRISDSERGYYVLGYTPRDGTFARPGKTARFHTISVNVKRPGLQVRTRKGFLGIADQPAAPPTPAQQLFQAAVSPFAETSIPVHATIVPGFRAGVGHFLRALVHIDAKGLTFAPDGDGISRARADVLALVFDSWGKLVTSQPEGFVATRDDNHGGSAGGGLVYSLRIPLVSSGGFHVRFAVRDERSGALGAVGEYLDVADASHGALALSGIVIGNKDDFTFAAAAGLTSGRTEAAVLRRVPAGTNLAYAYEIYNATAPVTSTVSVWRGNERVFEASADTLTPSQGSRQFTATGALDLGSLPAGEYELQVAAAMAKNKTAAQRIEFEIVGTGPN